MTGSQTAAQSTTNKCDKYTISVFPLLLLGSASYGIYRLALHLGADENTSIGVAAGAGAGALAVAGVASLAFCYFNKSTSTSDSQRAANELRESLAPEASV